MNLTADLVASIACDHTEFINALRCGYDKSIVAAISADLMVRIGCMLDLCDLNHDEWELAAKFAVVWARENAVADRGVVLRLFSVNNTNCARLGVDDGEMLWIPFISPVGPRYLDFNYEIPWRSR